VSKSYQVPQQGIYTTGLRLGDDDKKAAHDPFGDENLEYKEKSKKEINLKRLFEKLLP
jgi:hypothetical protein